MGTSPLYRKKKYLTIEEIDNVLNKKESLKSLFDKIRNSDGFFSLSELRQLTNGLLEEYIMKKIIQICGIRGHHLMYYDFLYFYAVLNTTSTNAKLNFILDFIFFKKDIEPKEKYIRKVKKYFYNSGVLIKLLLSNEIINNEDTKDDKIKRSFVYNYIFKNHLQEINNYCLFKDTKSKGENNFLTNSHDNILSSAGDNKELYNVPKKNLQLKDGINSEDEVSVLKDISNINNDSKNNQKNKNNNSILISKEDENKGVLENKKNNKKELMGLFSTKKLEKNAKIDNLKSSYLKLLNEQNIFPISLFEDMLKEINVKQSLIDVVGNFLRQKSQKTFITNFELFKEALSLIIIPNINMDINIPDNNNNQNNEIFFEKLNERSREEITDGLFTLFAYPNDFISKKSFFIFAKSTKPELSSNTINDWFNQYKITKNIDKKKFKEIIRFILDELIESFENIKYMPYIFFRASLKNRRLEKNCIEILLKNKSLNEYISERLQYDNDFYIVDKEFWDKWNQNMNKLEKKNTNDDNEIYDIGNNKTINMANIDDNKEKENTSALNKNNNENNNNMTSDLTGKNKTTSVGILKAEKIGLRIGTEKIADQYGKLKEGLVYLKDFIVLSPRMYSLFYKWYGTNKTIEIKRSKILLDDECESSDMTISPMNNIPNNNIDYSNKEKDKFEESKIDSKSNVFNCNLSNESSTKISISKIYLNKINLNGVANLTNNNRVPSLNQTKSLTKNYSYLKGENYNTQQKFEIELYPVFLLFFNFVDMQKKNSTSLEQIVESIKDSLTGDNIRYYQFSRKTKFVELLRTLQNSLKITLTRKNARLWVFYQERLELVELNDSLEKCGIMNSAVILLEINDNNYWPSERLEKEPINVIKKKHLNLVGLMNIGNTCYMNSILQIFLNIQDIKDIFLSEKRTKEEESKFFEFILNKKKPKNGELFLEFINLLKEKYIKNKKTITPKKFKEICGQYNETFKGYEQQDAHDFYTFLVDNLHEDTNIKSNAKQKKQKEESDTIDTTEIELSNEYWANTIRYNSSYIYGLFFGQLKSTLTCSECNKTKLKFENFSALELPIPEGGKIIIEILLFRLPCTLSPFYKVELNQRYNNENYKNNNTYNILNNNTEQSKIFSMKKAQKLKPITKINLKINNNSNDDKINEEKEEKEREVLGQDNNNNNTKEMDDKKENNGTIRIKLKKLKSLNIGKYAIDSNSSQLDSEKMSLNINIYCNNKEESKKKEHQKSCNESNLNTSFYEQMNNNININRSKIFPKLNAVTMYSIKEAKNINRNELISNPLNFNIPVKLRIKIDRKKKCSQIIEILKGMKELELDVNSKYTEFIMISKDKYIREDALIDEAFLNFEQVNIYELLNYEGIKKVFNYDDLMNYTALELKKQDVQSMIDIMEEEIQTDNNLSLFSENEKDSTSQYYTSDDKISKGKYYDYSQNIQLFSNELNNGFNTNEILIILAHMYKSFPLEDKDNDFSRIFNIKLYEAINTYPDYIILTSQKAIKPVNLYEMIWEKYTYFLDSPTKYQSSLWWKSFSNKSSSPGKDMAGENINDNNNNIGINIDTNDVNYTPFAIRIVKKSTKSCFFCPWFRICSGCILNPGYQDFLSLNNEALIIVEWKREVIKKDMQGSNVTFMLKHPSSNLLFETSEKDEDRKSIYDCLDLFTREEILKNITCEKCNKKTNFKKSMQIDKFPKYLVLILKRFKYTSMFTTKIDNLINFPIESLDLKNYVAQKEEEIKYDLFGVVNHEGGLQGGHYHCNIKQDSIWTKYDDSYTCEYNKKIETSDAYLLVYKYREQNNTNNEKITHEYKLNLMGLMDTAFKIYLKQYNFEHLFNYIYDNNENKNNEITKVYLNDCEFYYGEPITVNGKHGYLINIYKNNDSDKVYIKIKINKGYYETNIDKNKIIKETIKSLKLEITVVPSDKQNNEEENGKVFCSGCVMF